MAPGVPLEAHDLRSGGCGDGGVPDVGDSAGQTDCWFPVHEGDRAGGLLPVGFALRWEVRVAGAPPLTFWTTRVQNYTVGEVQVPTGR